MLDKINQLPSEIAFRKESDVEKTILQFYIAKTTPPPTPPDPDDLDDPISPTPPISSTDVVKEAKTKIKATNMPNTMWQMVILNLIDELPETADFFKRL